MFRVFIPTGTKQILFLLWCRKNFGLNLKMGLLYHTEIVLIQRRANNHFMHNRHVAKPSSICDRQTPSHIRHAWDSDSRFQGTSCAKTTTSPFRFTTLGNAPAKTFGAVLNLTRGTSTRTANKAPSHARRQQFWSQLVTGRKSKWGAGASGNVSSTRRSAGESASLCACQRLFVSPHSAVRAASISWHNQGGKHRSQTHACRHTHTNRGVHITAQLSVRLYSPSNNSIKHESQVRKQEQIATSSSNCSSFTLQKLNYKNKWGEKMWIWPSRVEKLCLETVQCRYRAINIFLLRCYSPKLIDSRELQPWSLRHYEGRKYKQTNQRLVVQKSLLHVLTYCRMTFTFSTWRALSQFLQLTMWFIRCFAVEKLDAFRCSDRRPRVRAAVIGIWLRGKNSSLRTTATMRKWKSNCDKKWKRFHRKWFDYV